VTDFTEQYEKLLITQYYQKDKARAEIKLQASTWQVVYDLLSQFIIEFDLDNATGDRLDKIGKIVGIRRRVPEALAKIFFGFDNNINSAGFASKFDASRPSAPFASRFSPTYTTLELSDPDYRLFIKAKISKNIASAYMVSDEKPTIQDAVITAFSGQAFVVDNYNMTATLYVSPSFSFDRIRLIQKLDLIPSGMGVGYNIVQAEPGETFGFDSNPNSKGFSSKFDTNYDGGIFARKVL